MRNKDVVTLKEVVNDLNDGKAFYDQRETGVGDYFWDSLIADIESLTRLSHFEKIYQYSIGYDYSHYRHPSSFV